MNLRAWILPAGMAAGGAAGVALGAGMGARWDDPALQPLVMPVRLAGSVFLALLKALTIPLIVTSVILAVAELGRARHVARIASWTASYFLTTTVAAVLTGLALVQALHPGAPLRAELAEVAVPESASRGALAALHDVVASMFPANLASAVIENNVLGLLVLSLIFGAALARVGERAAPLLAGLAALNEALFVVVRWIVLFAPLGIFGLVADRFGRAGGGAAAWGELQRLGWYALTVLLGLAFHAVITLSLLLKLGARRSPWRYATGLFEALLTAFGTASSAATLPVTQRCVTERNGVSRRAADFVLPLGTTVNMDGTALYEAVAVVFIAQSLGIELGIVQLALVALTATLAAIGAAAIPEAGLVTMVLVLAAVDLPADGIGLLLAIDWILDRFRTAVNVWGDAVGAAVIDRRLHST